jgi:flavorubredoxin
LESQKPIEIGKGVFWVGSLLHRDTLHCNPYLIIEGDEAILIDPGSRLDFPDVMLNVLQAGVKPAQITNIIYHHYDPDLCGSGPDLERMLTSKSLRIISHEDNHQFIRYFGVTLPMVCINTLGGEYIFKTGRKLTFHWTPFAHAEGSFMTFDQQTGILFSSDLFGSWQKKHMLQMETNEECLKCMTDNHTFPEASQKICGHACSFSSFISFHRKVMPTSRVLKIAMTIIEELPVTLIAPQHGSIIPSPYVQHLTRWLKTLSQVGIDSFIRGQA